MSVWRDADVDIVNEWRGSVEHVRTRRRAYFTDFVALVAFLAAYTSGAAVVENFDA